MSTSSAAPSVAQKPKTSSKHVEELRKRKFTPRPTRAAEDRLPMLYRALTDQVDEGHLTNAIKTCRKILILDPKSQAAFQTLLFLHLQTDDYNSALSLLSTSSNGSESSSSSSRQFEKAYCLYRLQREKEALVLLEEMKSSKGRKELHLEAQIRYRLGEYEKAQELYDDLLAGCDSPVLLLIQSTPEQPDILTNLKATTAHIDFVSHSYHSHLHSSTLRDGNSTVAHIPTEEDLETYVPSLPTGWAKGGVEGVQKAAVASASARTKAGEKPRDGGESKPKRRRHKLPKGAVEGKPSTQDPERWLPKRQRTSFLTAQGKKKGAMTSMGTGITQGSTTNQQSAGAGQGGGKKKKGKK